MNEKDKKIQELLKGNFDVPSPSADFTSKVMQSIEAKEIVQQPTAVDVPVVSRWQWVLIAATIALFVYLGLTSEEGSRVEPLQYLP